MTVTYLNKTQENIMLLFLDFDGVLHHEHVTLKRCGPTEQKYLSEDELPYVTHTCKIARPLKGRVLFEHCGRLVEALAPYPHIRIVISSSWREHFRPQKLLSFLPAELAVRVIGQTPVCDDIGGVGSRLCDVQAYLEGNGFAGEAWIALDDQPQLFWDDTEDFPPNLYYTPADGMAAEVAADFGRFLVLVNYQAGYLGRDEMKARLGVLDDEVIIDMFAEFNLRKMSKLTKNGA